MIRKICKFVVQQEHKFQNINSDSPVKKLGEIGVAVFNGTVIVVRQGLSIAHTSYTSISQQFSTEYKRAKAELEAQVREKPLFKDPKSAHFGEAMKKAQNTFQQLKKTAAENSMLNRDKGDSKEDQKAEKAHPPVDTSKKESKSDSNTKIVRVKYLTPISDHKPVSLQNSDPDKQITPLIKKTSKEDK